MEIRQLTFTRFLAAFTIVLFHYGQTAFPFKEGLLGHFAREGAFAVSFFFCLSGYILAHVYYNAGGTPIDKKTFFLKRFARIYPVYFLGFIVVLISAFVLTGALPKGNSIILQLLALHAWAPRICLEINYPAWSISVELFFYLCFPAVLLLFQKWNNRKIVISTLLLWLISASAFAYLMRIPGGNKWGEFILYHPFFHLNAFVFGMAACILLKRTPVLQSLNTFATTCGILLSIGALFLVIATDNPALKYVHNGLLAPLFVVVIVLLHSDKGVISKIFSLTPMVFLGEISYGIYILQHPVRIWFEKWMQSWAPGMDETLKFYLFSGILIAVSAMVYRVFEKPLRRIIVRKYSR